MKKRLFKLTVVDNRGVPEFMYCDTMRMVNDYTLVLYSNRISYSYFIGEKGFKIISITLGDEGEIF